MISSHTPIFSFGIAILICLNSASGFLGGTGMSRVALRSTQKFTVFDALQKGTPSTETEMYPPKSMRDLDGVPRLIPFNNTLPDVTNGVSVLSFNVLLPNSGDGWWVYKDTHPLCTLIADFNLTRARQYYQAHVPQEHREWPHRRGLLRNLLLQTHADVVCIQEASADTFHTDFSFMGDAGYHCVLHSKFRFRSATFYKASRLDLAFEKHKDRTLVTGFRTIAKTHSIQEQERTKSGEIHVGVDLEATGTTAAGAGEAKRGELLVIVNCHLSGGPSPDRRLRQVVDALDAVRKEAIKVMGTPLPGGSVSKGARKETVAGGGGSGKATKKEKGASVTPLTSIPVIVCGDFNEQDGRTAVSELLGRGRVLPSFREEGHPLLSLTSKEKKQGFGPFGDLYKQAFSLPPTANRGEALSQALPPPLPPPPTFLVPLLHPLFLGEGGTGISTWLRDALTKVFSTFSGGKDFLSREDMEAWLLKINRAGGRGSEYRAAEALVGPEPGAVLTLADFLSIYESELQEGKFWGVAHDLTQCGVEAGAWLGVYEARFDRIFYTQSTLEAIGARETLSEGQRKLVYGGDCLPNSWHPSDHLPIGGVFQFKDNMSS